MLDKFEIQGFRCFRQFEITGLKRINLIGGKNGSGKSSLLEAVRLYVKPDMDGVRDILDWRDEIPADHDVWKPETIGSLFFASGKNEPRLHLRADRLLELRLAWHRRDPDGLWKLDSTPVTEPARDAQMKQVLRFEYPGENGPHYFLLLDGSVEVDRLSPGTPHAERAFLRYARATDRPAIYMRSDPLDSDALSELFEEIAATPIEDEVNAMIRWIIPGAERLLTKGTGDQRILFVKRKTANGPEPLKRFGDGAVRLTALALALANTPNGYCLIDEIENGIHYELFDRIWETLALMSKKLNVQLFATTHSKDCLDAFERACRNPDFDACFYRLERENEDIKAVRLDYSSFFSVFAGTPHEVR